METLDNSQQFSDADNFLLMEVDTSINIFHRKANALSWVSIDEVNNWKYVIPYSNELSELDLLHSDWFPHFTQKDEWREWLNKNQWISLAENWFSTAKDEIRRKTHKVKAIIKDGLPQLNKKYKTELTSDEVFDKWVELIKQLNWAEFHALVISERKTGPVIAQIVKQRNHNFTPITLKTPVYQSFTDLFYNSDDIKICVDVIRNYDIGKVVLGEALNWIGGDKRKFVVVAWIDCLYHFKKIRTDQYKEVNPVLINEFKGFSIGRRTLYDKAGGYDQAKKYFTVNIPH